MVSDVGDALIRSLIFGRLFESSALYAGVLMALSGCWSNHGRAARQGARGLTKPTARKNGFLFSVISAESSRILRRAQSAVFWSGGVGVIFGSGPQSARGSLLAFGVLALLGSGPNSSKFFAPSPS